MVAATEMGLITIPLDWSVAHTVQVGDMLKVEITARNIYPQTRIVQTYRVMSVDRINVVVTCRLVSECEV